MKGKIVLEETVYDGKYTVILTDKGELKALRYGEDWRDCVGDGLILALAQKIEFLRNSLKVIIKNKTIFTLILDDHHNDIEVELYFDKDKALTEAKRYVNEECEGQIWDEIVVPGFLYVANHQGESDSIMVQESEVIE